MEKVCRPCHTECRDGCDGPESTDCEKCLNFYDKLDVIGGDVRSTAAGSGGEAGRKSVKISLRI